MGAARSTGSTEQGGTTTRSAQDRLLKAAARIAAQRTEEGVCEAVLDALDVAFGVRNSWILLQEVSRPVLGARACRGAGATVYAGTVMPQDQGIAGVCFSRRTGVFVPDVQAENRWYDVNRLHESSLHAVLTLPLMFEDTVVGVLGLDWADVGAESPPSPRNLESLEALAAQAAVAVTNARSHQDAEPKRPRVDRDRTRAAIVGSTDAWTSALRQAELVARGETAVLLLGETGTGKALVARFVHDHSARAGSPFVVVNCAALPATSVERELFGREGGAFAVAQGGTVFLDEIGDLPTEAQAKLLRALQEAEAQGGAGTPGRADVRVIAATHQDLSDALGSGRIREDLYYRLSAFPIQIPALRDRAADIPALAEHFVREFGAKLGKPGLRLGSEAADRLARHRWPGNVRELANSIERAVILCDGGELDADTIAFPTVLHVSEAPRPDQAAVPFADAERAAILRALEEARWRISGPQGAAGILRLKPTTLHAKMRKLGIRRPPRQ